MSVKTVATTRRMLVERSLRWAAAQLTAHASPVNDVKQENAEKDVDEAARWLVRALDEAPTPPPTLSFTERLEQVIGTVKVLCDCQQMDPPAPTGCPFCEGDGVRLVEVRRNGQVRVSGGVYPPSEWTRLPV